MQNELYQYEYTDTFGGEANYCWVNRGVVAATSLKQAARKARAELGLNNIRGDIKWDLGDEIAWVPQHACTILFVEFMGEGG